MDDDNRKEKNDDDDDDDDIAAKGAKIAAPESIPKWSIRREVDAEIVFVDGFKPPSTAEVPMFDDPPPLVKWDEYGSLIEPMDFIGSKADKRDLPAPSALNTDNPEDPGAIDLPSRSSLDVPTKLVYEDITVNVACIVEYMDFEGLSDGRSIRNVITRVGPHSLILVNGSTEATESIKSYFQSANITAKEKIYAPNIGETIDASSDIVSYKVNLSDSLLSTLSFTKLGSYEVAWLDAQIQDGKPPLLTKPDGNTTSTGFSTLFIGDPKLSDFRQLLQSAGIRADFAEGTLVCGSHGAVMVKRAGENLVLEGGLCQDYFKIRELLYSQYHQLVR